MSYVTEQQLVERFGAERLAQLTDRAVGEAIDDNVLAEAVADAASFIDSYLAPRYPLPLAAEVVAASPLARICGDVVLYLLSAERVTDDVQDRYDRAVGWLKDVRSNRASLGVEDAAVPAPSGRTVVRAGASGHDWDAFG